MLIYKTINFQFYNLAEGSNNAKRKNNQESAYLSSLGSKECWEISLETMVDRVTYA